MDIPTAWANDIEGVIKHFKSENVPTSTNYSIINRYNNGVSFLEKPKTDKPFRLSKAMKKKAVKKHGKQSRHVSEEIGKKIWGYIRYFINEKNNLTYYKRRKAPRYTVVYTL